MVESGNNLEDVKNQEVHYEPIKIQNVTYE